MNDSFYQSILEETATAYAYHRILLDDGGAPCDFVYLEVGPTVARFTGLRPAALLGRRACEVLPAMSSAFPEWIRRFGEVALTGRPADFDAVPPFTAIPCSLHVYSPQKGYFVVLYRDPPAKAPDPVPATAGVTANPVARALADLSDALRNGVSDEAADHSVADALLRLGEARYAAYHRLLPDGTGFETVAVAGVPHDTLSALDELGIRLVGRHWTWCADGSARIPRRGSVVFPDAPALASALLPASLGTLAAGLDTGEAVLAGIPALPAPDGGHSPASDPNPAPAGFFTLLMPAGRPFTAHDAILALAGEVSGHLARRRAATLLRESESQLAILSDSAAGRSAEQLGTVFELSVCALFLIRVHDNDFRYERVNRATLMGANPDDAVGRTPADVFGQERGDRLAVHFARCVREARITTFEESLQVADGWRVFRTVLYPIIEDGRVCRLVGASGDVTDHRASEDALRENLRRSEVLLGLLKRRQATQAEFLGFVLEQAMVYTASAMGGIFLYDKESGRITLQSARGGWDSDPDTGTPPLSATLEQAGVWGEAVREGRPVRITRSDTRTVAQPAGPGFDPPAAANFLCVPVFDIGRVVAVIGVGVRDGDYTSQDATQLGIIMNTAWTVVERMRSDERLRSERDLLRATLLSIGDGIVATGPDGTVILINDVARALTGWTGNEAIGQPLDTVLNLIDEHTREPFALLGADPLLPVSRLPDTLLLLSRDGSSRPVADSIAPIHDDTGKAAGLVIAFRDVTQERQRQESITYLSYHDQLTGLYNRRFFEEELRRLNTRRNLPITLVMADVNALKLTNDAFGHATGDRLLRAAADALRAGCREDDIIARLGGDEFIILLPRTSAEEAATVVSRVKDLCDATRVETATLSISFGLDTKTLPSEDVQDTFKRAEDRMYRQKLFDSPGVRSRSVQSIIQALYAAQPREEAHSRRVAVLCEALGQELGLPEHLVKELRTAGLLYDIGKIAISEDILEKHAALSEEERREIRRHSEIGYRILSSVNELSEIADYILLHHERWDGTGYPKGLQGTLTPLPSRIIGLADAYDAMTSERPYRDALSREEALKILQGEAGTKFDPELVKVFTEHVAAKAPEEP